MPGIGCAECQPDQNERERMLAVLTEAGVRPEPGRTQGGESDGSGQKPGEYSQDDDHEDGISRFIDRIPPHPNLRCPAVNDARWSHNASRTPRPNINRSLICTGSRRVAPTPGLSSIRTAISVGAVANRDRSTRRSKSSSSAAQALLERPQPVAMATISATAAAGVG